MFPTFSTTRTSLITLSFSPVQLNPCFENVLNLLIQLYLHELELATSKNKTSRYVPLFMLIYNLLTLWKMRS